MIKKETIWNIIENNIKNKGLVSHQLDSFNHFLNFGIEQVIQAEADISITPKKGQKYTVSFGEVHIPFPKVMEEDRILRTLYPFDARLRDLTYSSPVCVDITETMTEDGKQEKKKNLAIHRRVIIGYIPIMLGCNKCNLCNLTKKERIRKGECGLDPGGYFIIKGKERVLVTQMRANYNTVIVLSQKEKSKCSYIAKIRSMSEETGHSVLVLARISSNERDIHFSLPYIEKPIHAGIVFKALGFIKDNDIKNLIGLPSEKAQRYIRLIIRDSFFIKDQDSALTYIGQYAINIIPKEKHRAYAWQVVETELFPHMGITASIKSKASLLGYMIKKLLRTYIKERVDDDRDHIMNKRIEVAGTLCCDLFRTLFKRYIKTIQLQLQKRHHRTDAMTIISRLTSITDGFRSACSTGNWGVRTNLYIRTGVSQVMSRMTYGATLSHLRRVVIPVGKEGKNAKIRQINTSSYGMFCPLETPEGHSAGIVLNFPLLTKTTIRTPTVLLKDIVEHVKGIIPINEIKIENIQTHTFVFLNGIIMGITQNPNLLVERLRRSRNRNLFDKSVSITYDKFDNEVKIFSDAGRISRPLFTIGKDGKLKIEEKDSCDWDQLVDKNLIRYVDCSEIENSVIAMYPKDIKKHDYCEIHPSLMLGIMASTIPFPDHSPAPRNVYQCLWAEEKIVMADLSTKKISDIVIGDEVITVDPHTYEQTKTKVINQYVKPTKKRIIKIVTISGRKLVATDDHPILTSKCWKEAGRLETSDLVCISLSYQKDIVSKEYLKYIQYQTLFNPNLTLYDRPEWLKSIVIKGTSIFVPVEKIIPHKNVMIADITTESNNHSFITGDGICVHNSSMGKQALGLFAQSFGVRTDTIVHILAYPQKSLVSTKMANFTGFNEMPSGINAIVAIICYKGFNQEDSIIMNKSAIDRGLFHSTSYRCVSTAEKRQGTYNRESIELPPKEIQKRGTNYSLLNHRGIVRKGMIVKRGDIIIGKILIKSSKTGEEKKIDCSVAVKGGEEGIVDRVLVLKTPNGYKLVKVIIRRLRVPELGDKFASRSAQKATLGMIYNQEDMPFTADGIVPDILLNPHAIKNLWQGYSNIPLV